MKLEIIPLEGIPEVVPGDELIYRTAGGGGWKDPFDRPAELVGEDVLKGLVSREKAYNEYGVVMTDEKKVDTEATSKRRTELREAREASGGIKDFDFGPPLDEVVANSYVETGLEAPHQPKQLSWARMETQEAATRRVRNER